MRKYISILFSLILLAGCMQQPVQSTQEKKTKVGIMLSDVGLGDQSFSDSAFRGLQKSRDELGIQFDYKELKDSKTYEKGIEDLVKAGNDVVVGLGFMVQEDLEKVAKKYPKQRFILIDAVSELKNITSLTFKEDEGSYLAGALAAMKSKSAVIGFVGGADVPLIRKFLDGFQKGALAINPEVQVKSVFAENFGDDKLGAELASNLIKEDADLLYAAAGFTGVGVLKEAQKQGVYGIGVDSDQYFYAEKAVITSMLKNVDVALYEIVKDYKKSGKLPEGHVEFGIAENGVALAPVRILELSPDEQSKLDSMIKEFGGTAK
ncbi:BMP family ABC transporter substrate-binding protein [Metabacillus sp. KIGAM252]|uniref:BMP family ABC transporter substrate-binding protein n=1 Tax=Metabacillus flavus TaxID=2823519 RepID=A0ABS5LCN8_9BACI|nr:BMP family ABC transporter substrate-binding protein [Metabacillus flavus]MBS2968348.1 BMP family ABC transporter substrate-binding protein [Metabacillus flavus]